LHCALCNAGDLNYPTCKHCAAAIARGCEAILSLIQICAKIFENIAVGRLRDRGRVDDITLGVDQNRILAGVANADPPLLSRIIPQSGLCRMAAISISMHVPSKSQVSVLVTMRAINRYSHNARN